MTLEDLKQARIHLWHQDGVPVLTTEDVTAWLDEIGFCSLLPGAHPLASLAQAVAGNAEKAPEKEAQDSARQLSAQLMQARSAVPILWEEVSMLTGEQFDALASVEVLPYLYCLRGDRDLKKVPQGSPLMQAVWQELQSGAKTVAEIIDGVGRELTEAAILRALRELWAKLRAVPMLETQPSETGAKWELLQKLWPEQVRRGATMSHPLALSAMISVYLGGAVAATADEVEDALGPLASRSRVREVLNALQATRQVKMFPVGRSSAYALSGSSAEILDEVATQRDSDALKASREEAGAREPNGRSPREFGERKAWARDKKAVSKRPVGKKPVSDGPVSATPDGGKPADSERRPFVKRPDSGKPPWKPRAEGGAGFVRKEWKPRAEGTKSFSRTGERSGPPRSGAGKPWQKREGGERSAGPGARKPWVKHDRGERPPGDRKEWKPRAAGSGFPARKSASAGRPYVKREGGDRPARSFGARPAGERKEWKPRAAGAGFPARKPYVKRDGADRPERKPYVKRDGADRPPRPAGDRPTGERREWKARPTPGERKPGGTGKPFGTKTFGKKPFGAKPATAGRPFGKKPFGAKPAGGKFAARKPFGAKSGGKSFGAPGAFKKKRPASDSSSKDE
jgi:23S rRNA pseudouridine2605 synthase